MSDLPPASYFRAAMKKFDGMDKEWAQLVRDYGPPAEWLWEDRVPMCSTDKAMTAAEARRQLESEYGRPI